MCFLYRNFLSRETSDSTARDKAFMVSALSLLPMPLSLDCNAEFLVFGRIYFSFFLFHWNSQHITHFLSILRKHIRAGKSHVASLFGMIPKIIILLLQVKHWRRKFNPLSTISPESFPTNMSQLAVFKTEILIPRIKNVQSTHTNEKSKWEHSSCLSYFFTFVWFDFETESHYTAWMFWNSLGRAGWAWTHRDPLPSARI